MTDWAYSGAARSRGRPSWTPGCPDCGFVFPDNEALVQAEFQKNLPFASTWRSRSRPRRPGLAPRPHDEALLSEERRHVQVGPSRGRTTSSDYSYGDPQAVQVLATAQPGRGHRQLADRTAARRPQRTTDEWAAGRSTTRHDRYYHVMRGDVTGTNPGDCVRSGSRRAADERATPSRTRRSASRPTTSSSSPPRTTRASRSAPRASHRRAELPRLLPRRAGCERHRRRRLRRRRPRPRRAPTTSASSATTRRSSGTRATTSSRASPAGAPAMPHGSRWTSCCTCART